VSVVCAGKNEKNEMSHTEETPHDRRVRFDDGQRVSTPHFEAQHVSLVYSAPRDESVFTDS